MLFFLGLSLLLFGIIMVVRFLITFSKTRLDAVVLFVSKEYLEIPIRKALHAQIEYSYQNQQYALKIPLKSSAVVVGDRIKICIKPGNPYKAEHYHPRLELIGILVMNGVGAALVIISLLLIK